MRHRLSFLRLSLCSLFLLLLATTTSAQFKASVQGTVTDTSGAIIPEAAITLTNKETNKEQTTTASDEGFYRISGLPPGQYTISAEKAGYKMKMVDKLTVNEEETKGE